MIINRWAMRVREEPASAAENSATVFQRGIILRSERGSAALPRVGVRPPVPTDGRMTIVFQVLSLSRVF